ncbi:MAG TPA: hypothetical protein VN790_03120 [Steroidobacteraceae bacterium]|nr:hypothetical protein [Steroidobacteraceae bacterium]
MSSARTATIGGRDQLQSGSAFEAGAAEDVEVDHSPDATLACGDAGR